MSAEIILFDEAAEMARWRQSQRVLAPADWFVFTAVCFLPAFLCVAAGIGVADALRAAWERRRP